MTIRPFRGPAGDRAEVRATIRALLAQGGLTRTPVSPIFVMSILDITWDQIQAMRACGRHGAQLHRGGILTAEEAEWLDGS